MTCPACHNDDSCFVVESRVTSDARRRRYYCERCKGRFTTYEITATEFERLQQVRVDEAQVERAIAALTTIKAQLGSTNGLPAKN